MLTVDGYTIWECIHESPHSEVYTGTRLSDGRRVILKRYRRAPVTSTASPGRELELLSRIDDEGVTRAIELRSFEDRPVLVLERFPGYPLSRYARRRKLTITEILQIGLGVARGLIAVHDARVIHRDVKLSNILLDPKQMRTCLIDFGISTEYGRAEHTAPPELPEGTVHSIAPEQTGRTGFGVDFRTDLYGLGACIYELLTGSTLFPTKTGIDLVYAHIALRPRSAADVDARVPIALSRVVDKLLEKDPELRYQTARGVAADLEICSKQLEAQGAIDEDLQLGVFDASDRLRFPSRLYGREAESRVLLRALERVSQKRVEWVLLAGPAGIGKSSLPSVLREPLARAGGYLADAKFDLELRDRPYAGFAAALHNLLGQLLLESREGLEVWREKIRAEVGPIGRVLVDLAPSLGYLIDDFPALPQLGATEERERLSLAVIRFVRAVARAAHPLVLFLDDLQWADAGSLALLSALVRSQEPEALLVIGGYRDTEVGPEHALTRLMQEIRAADVPVHHITVAPLGVDATTAMLADALGRTPADTAWLARVVGAKCQHNPLLVRRLMYHLWDRDLIRHDHERGWTWDETRIREADIPDDAATMLGARIDALADAARELVTTASLIGTVFELDMLEALLGRSRAELLQQLMQLVDQGLVSPCRAGFKFTHDRIREAAQSCVGGELRAELHRRVAALLLDRTPGSDLPKIAFELADHLGAALDHLDASERARARDIFHLAGRRALARGVPDTAAHYLELAWREVDERQWAEDPARVHPIALDRAEAACQMRRLDVTLDILAELERRDLPVIVSAQIAAKRITAHVMAGDESVVDLAIDALGRFAARWPRSPSRVRTWLAVTWTDWCVRGRAPGWPRGRRSDDTSWLGPVLVIRAASPVIARRCPALYALTIAYVFRHFQRHSTIGAPGQSLAAFAGICITELHSLRRAQWYARAAEEWSVKFAGVPHEVRARFTLHASVYSWLRPRRMVVEPLERLAEAAREVGDLEYVDYTLYASVVFAALSGERIPELTARMKRVRAAAMQTERYVAQSMEHAYTVLRDGVPGGIDWDAERARIDELFARPTPGDFLAFVHLIAMYCVLGAFDLAADASDRFWRVRCSSALLGSRIADYVLYRGLAHAALAERATQPSARRQHTRILRACARQLRAWACFSPDLVHMSQMLEAERVRVRGRVRPALERYQMAAQQARRVGYTHHAALTHERRAQLLALHSREIEAGAALGAASRLYREWGAHAKAEELERARG